MRFWQALPCLLLSCPILLAYPMLADWRTGERLLFPEQLEYLQRHEKYCHGDDDLIFWGDGRCYRENETGPCFAGRVITIDRKLLRAYCREESSI